MKLYTYAFYPGSASFSSSTDESDNVISYQVIAEPNEPATAMIKLKDPDGTLAAKYGISPIYAAKYDSGGLFIPANGGTDDSADANSPDTDDMELLPADPAVNDCYLFGFDTQFKGLALDIGQAGAGGWALTWSYPTDAVTWANFAGVTDDTNAFKTAGLNIVDWTMPGAAWVQAEYAGKTKYWAMAWISASTGWVTQPLGTRAYIQNYIGCGKVIIQDPDGTPIFNGCMMKISHDSNAGVLTLYCEDWLTQLKAERLQYDMRENIDGSGLRQSVIKCDLDAATSVPVDTAGGPVYYIYDDEMSGVWANDEWNGAAGTHYVVLPNEIAGDIKVKTGPSTVSISNVNYDDKPVTSDTQHLWVDDANTLTLGDDDAEICYMYLTFQLNVTEGSLYNSISAMRINLTVSLEDAAADATFGVRHTNEATLYPLGTITNDATTGVERKYSFIVSPTLFTSVLESDGTIDFYFLLTSDAAVTVLDIHFAELEVDVNVDGYNSTITITDTVGSPARLTVSTNVDVAGLGLWNGCPYAIVKNIYKHIDSVEGGTLVTGGDPLVVITSADNIEHTTGISSRHYWERTRLDILKDLAKADKVLFYMPVGSTELYWKKTFNDGAPTALTDDSVLAWVGGEYNIGPIRNEYHLYGIRTGDEQLFIDSSTLSPDPGADSKLLLGHTRSDAISNTGTTTGYEIEELADALVERDEDIHLFLKATLAGLSSLRLGSEVSITSSFLGMNSLEYVVTHWQYNSSNHQTVLRMQPRGSVGFQAHLGFGEFLRQLSDESKQTRLDTYSPTLYKQDW